MKISLNLSIGTRILRQKRYTYTYFFTNNNLKATIYYYDIG